VRVSAERWRELLDRYSEGTGADVERRVITLASTRQWSRIARRLGGEITPGEAKQLAAWLTSRDLCDEVAIEQRDKIEVTARPDGAIEVLAHGMIRTLDQLLAAAEVDRDEWTVEEWKANTWASAMKGKDGEPVVVRLWQVKARLLPRRLPISSVISITPLPRQKPRATQARDVCLFVPDTQHGFRWTAGHQRLRPMHDRAACDLAIQCAQVLQPATIVLLGDHLDLAEWSTKYPRPPEHIETTEPAARELHWFLAQLRLACPSARIVYLEGNHDARIRKLMEERAPGGARLRPVDDPDGTPMLSIPRLLALDALDVEYVGPYGAEWWWGDVRVTHGDTVRGGGGKTTSAVVAKSHHSTVMGHIHRAELASRTVHGQDGPRIITAMSPGCLTKLTAGEVPAAHHTGQDWQQALGVGVRHRGHVSLSLLPIHAGTLAFPDGRVLIGDSRDAEIAEAIGYPQSG
jgi:hypothetical protein